MQVVDYVRTGHDDGPALVLAGETGELESVALDPGVELAYSLGDRRCAGRIVDGRHERCERDAAPYCGRHTERWPCARCTGNCEKPIENCERRHAVYLAAFAPDRHKVGVTKVERLETRLCEQGADRAAHVRTVADGRIAREIEARIAERIPDRARAPTKVAGLHREVDEDTWNELLADFDPIETFEFDYGPGSDGARGGDGSENPLHGGLAEAPIPETTATGTVVGVQGRVLVLADGGTTYAVDLRDLLGREVSAGRTDRERQASLGSFS